ncbi:MULTISPECIES: hypothetical protein [Asticcacaulis]|uniref:hypothetical protein n=1 Tax=Asticcacaulis TaxID=76890 RepID=UPI001AE907EC|nr:MULTISPECIES: hypothetical protein [Asticcacaulis]MBP2157549.1 hypothetical protein [Asticcacaulis solisilvae]MDR6798594.1 hypothetical protein [Asticcacaulis sp. BE141]
MRNLRLLALGAVSLLILASCTDPQSTQDQTDASSEAAPEPRVSDQPLSCDHPVKPDATAESLLAEYGERAVTGLLSMPDNEVVNGVVLFRDKPDERIEVIFRDKEMTKVAEVRLGEAATAWRGPGGVGKGTTLAEVQAANGPFLMSGFRFDWGGEVIDWRGGKLETLEGGCALKLRLQLPAGAKASADEEIESNDERLKGLDPAVVDMAIVWKKKGLFGG